MSSAIPPSARILTRSEVMDRYRRSRSGRVVFTNGCFDVLHRGHIEYLFAARALGTALVIGLNTDDSVRRLKGEGRPLNREIDRAFVLAGLACVDAVTLFDEDTPARLIAELLPDVLVKGGDYRPEDVVGRADVEAAGGRLVIVPLIHGYSTTALFQRISQ